MQNHKRPYLFRWLFACVQFLLGHTPKGDSGHHLQDTGLPLSHTQKTLLQRLFVETKHGFFKKGKSFYIHGKTGTGKTTIMEKFIVEMQKSENGGSKKVLAMHFHDYLLDITKLLVSYSPKEVAKKISQQVSALCFDEFFIESIADAKILYDVFFHLIQNKTTIVLTSNFKPEELYRDGFNRQIMFPKFSDFLHQKMEIFELTGQDYRTQTAETTQICFENLNKFAEHFNAEIELRQTDIEVDSNHFVQVAGFFQNGTIISYPQIFKKHSSIKDFRLLSRKFQHIHINLMEQFCELNEDEAIRFRNFVDITYTRGTILSFDTAPSTNFFTPKMLENIKFMRCQSRILEMQTKGYVFSQEKQLKRQLTGIAFNFFQNF